MANQDGEQQTPMAASGENRHHRASSVAEIGCERSGSRGDSVYLSRRSGACQQPASENAAARRHRSRVAAISRAAKRARLKGKNSSINLAGVMAMAKYHRNEK
jgi:hypothetical protein